MSSHRIFAPCEYGTTIIPILKLRKPRLEDLGQLPNVTQYARLVSDIVEHQAQADSKGLAIVLKYF
jgi:hypothetical protein